MSKSLLVVLWVATLGVAGVLAWRLDPPAPELAPPPPLLSEQRINAAIRPIPSSLALDARLVALGERLFHDTRLSVDGTTSCASCHDLASGGDDGRPVSVGVGGRQGTLNAPTVFNSAFNFRQFWDGRAGSLEEQVDGPLQHPAEMANDWPRVVAALEADAGYREGFAALGEESVTADGVRRAIAAFERSLLTPDSRFDRWLNGDATALDADERAGFQLFVDAGCITCHQGVNVGGNMFQSLGQVGDYFADRGDVTESDLGRFNVTGRAADRHKFKVPTLRNVELTAPYFHDGSVQSLEEAVQTMARYQLGVEFESAELSRLVAFLRALTGQAPGR